MVDSVVVCRVRWCGGSSRPRTQADAIKTNPKLIASFGVDGVADMAETQKLVLDAAKQTLRETPEPTEAIEPTSDLWTSEEWTIEKQRQFVRQFIAEITLTRGGKGPGSAPIQNRLAIRWAGQDEFDTTLVERMEQSEAHVLDHLVPSVA